MMIVQVEIDGHTLEVLIDDELMKIVGNATGSLDQAVYIANELVFPLGELLEQVTNDEESKATKSQKPTSTNDNAL